MRYREFHQTDRVCCIFTVFGTNLILNDRSLVSDGAVAAVVTRSPEIVAVINAPRTPFGNVTIVFDSHPRPEHPLGAAFLMYQSPRDAAAYLDKLFEVDPAIMRDLSWQTQMLSRYSAHVISMKYSTEEETITSVYEANIKLLNYSENIKEAISREAATQAELSTLRDALKRQREAREKACQEEEEAARKLDSLRKELDSARQFVLSLVNPGAEPPRGHAESHDGRKTRRVDDPISDKKGKQWGQSVHTGSGIGWGIPSSQQEKKSNASQVSLVPAFLSHPSNKCFSITGFIRPLETSVKSERPLDRIVMRAIIHRRLLHTIQPNTALLHLSMHMDYQRMKGAPMSWLVVFK